MLMLKLEAVPVKYVPIPVVFEELSLFEQANHQTPLILRLRHGVREYTDNVQSAGRSAPLDSTQNALPLITLNKMKAPLAHDEIETPRECVCAHIAYRRGDYESHFLRYSVEFLDSRT